MYLHYQHKNVFLFLLLRTLLALNKPKLFIKIKINKNFVAAIFSEFIIIKLGVVVVKDTFRLKPFIHASTLFKDKFYNIYYIIVGICYKKNIYYHEEINKDYFTYRKNHGLI